MGSLRIAPPEIVRKFLVEADGRYGTSGTYVDVRQASVGDSERRFELFKTITEKTDSTGNKSVDYTLQLYELMWLEFELVLAGTNIENADGGPLIEFQDGRVKDREKMRIALRSMGDHALLEEIHTCSLEVNTHWKSVGAKPVGE